jgi:hypothetical protein
VLFFANKISRKFSSWRFLSGVFLLTLAVVGGCSLGFRAVANNNDALQQTAQRLAERVAAIPGLRGPLRLQWHPDEKWSEGEKARWLEIFRGELEKRSINLTEDSAAPALVLHATETPTQVVFTANTHVADRDEARFAAVDRALLPPSTLPVAPVRLDRQMIYESPERILDAASLGYGGEVGLAMLLYTDFEVVATRVDAKGTVKESVPVTFANLKPSRDPHGEMTPRGNLISVQLWGKSCEFSWEWPADAKCHAEKTAGSGKSPWRGPILLTSPCDGSGWVLQNSGGEPNAKDVLQVIPEETVRESSAAVLSEFPGPILGMNTEQNPGSALVIARNLQTGNYEVYKIALACGD